MRRFSPNKERKKQKYTKWNNEDRKKYTEKEQRKRQQGTEALSENEFSSFLTGKSQGWRHTPEADAAAASKRVE